jgi:transposase
MRYLGIDVHVATTVFCLLDAAGEVAERGTIATTAIALQKLARRLRQVDQLIVGQEVGKMSYLVHDALTAIGITIKSFNAHHLRMIASSRKKTDRRDAFWIAKALPTGMTPPEVYIPTGQVRRLRSLRSRRAGVSAERQRWLLRARSHLQAAGLKTPQASRSVQRLTALALMTAEGADAYLLEALALCDRMERRLSEELKLIEATIHKEVKANEAVQLLMTIPSVGERVAVMLAAWMGEVTRLANARLLASYVGLVPSVHQSGATLQLGGITKAGTAPLRAVLVQAAQVLMFRCRTAESEPLRAVAMRVHTTRKRRKIAVVAAARHILRVAYDVLRDKTPYDPSKLKTASAGVEEKRAA